MKQITAALAAIFISLTMLCAPSSALDRVQHLTGINPQSTWMNQAMRDERLGIGTYWWNAFGSNTSYGGAYSNCSAAPVTGLYVAVAATGASENCAVYQLAADDTTGYGGYPSGVGTFLPADTTQVVIQGLVPAGSSTANIGPLGVGSTSGQSIANLIECKVTTSDTTSQTVNIVSSGGAVTSTNANRDRVDRLSCQDKQSASAVSPTTPTVDTGYVPISVVLVSFGTSTVTTGMISASTLQNFSGFLASNNGVFYSNPSVTAYLNNLFPGDIVMSRSSSIGVAVFGGSTSAGSLAFGTPNANVFTFNYPVTSTESGATVSSYLPPMYTAAGAATGSTMHGVQTTCTFAASTACAITLTGAAVFTSTSTYSCSASPSASAGPSMYVANFSGTDPVVEASSSTSITAAVTCFGT
jgi:hypothetical protein